MTIRDDTQFLEVDESFLINHSDLPLLEEELQTLIAELSKILSNKNVSLLVEMHERLNELKMKVYNSMIFKIVCEEYMNRRSRDRCQNARDSPYATEVFDMKLRKKLLNNYNLAAEKMAELHTKPVLLLQEELSKCQKKYLQEKQDFELYKTAAKHEIQQLKEGRKVDKETLELQKMELQEQAEILEETTDLLKNTTKELKECKLLMEQKICTCQDIEGVFSQGDKKATETIKELKEQIELYKNELLKAQSLLTEAEKEVVKNKQITEDLQLQLISRERNLAEKQQKIQDVLTDTLSLKEEIRQLKENQRYMSSFSDYSEDTLEQLKIKLTYSESDLETSRCKLGQKENELLSLRKIQSDTK